jgi:hypothetical protein
MKPEIEFESDPEWKFSDGTIVRLGGVVEGDSAFADRLRTELELLPLGRAKSVCVDPHPTSGVTLDPSDPRHVEIWTDDLARFYDVSLTSGPTLETDDENGLVH